MPVVEALAVRGENIVAVGTNEDMLALGRPETSVIDLGGKTLLPGFVDSHNHLFNDAEGLMGLTLEEAQDLALRRGITAIADMFVNDEFLEQMRIFEAEGGLRIRTSLYLTHTDNCGNNWGDWYRDQPPVRDPQQVLRIPGIKIFADGGSCREPAYSFSLPEWAVEESLQGDLFFSEEELSSMVADAQEAGYQVAIHAIGDRAIETALNALERALAGQPNTYRHRMEHNSMIRPDLVPRYGELGIIPSVWGQSYTCWILDEGEVGPRGEITHPYGEAVQPWTNPVRSLIDANPGLRIAWQSDLPWVGEGPISDLYSLVTRKEIRDDGVTVCDPPDWLAAEAITVEEALRLMTINAAYSIFMEEKIGSLKPGKYADLVVLSDNPLIVDPDSLIGLEVVATVIGGRVEYCSRSHGGFCDELTSAAQTCIPSGDHASIQRALTKPGSRAILCQNAVFELSEAIYYTADNQHIYTQGFPRDDSRALLRVVGNGLATAVSAEGNDYVSIRNVIIDGNRPKLGIAEGALINFGRGVEGHDAEGHLVEWVKAYEPRGWAIIYLGGPCRGAVARNNEVGPAGRAEYLVADGISLECHDAVVENNTIIDATDGGIVIFQSPGALIANNTIRAENRIMFYGISMVDYWPLEGDFTGTRVTGNVIDAAGAMIRHGIAMGPHAGCHPEGEPILRSRGAVVTGNTLMGDHMAYGFVVGGVEDWTVSGNVDLSTHLTPEVVADCFGNVVDAPSGFQFNPATSSGTFQAEFEDAVLGGTTDMWTVQAVVSETCVSDLIGAEVFEDIKAGNRGELGPALEAAPNGERIGRCISIYQPPDISDLTGDVGFELLPCSPSCVELRLFNLSDDTADLRRAEFLLDDFLVPCLGLPTSLEPWDEVRCTIEDFVTPGFHVLRWYGLEPYVGLWIFNYPLDDEG